MGQQLAQSLGANPQTLTPEVVAQIKGNSIDQAQRSYSGNLGAGLERAGAAGAYRDGSTRLMERDMATDLAGQIGNINRQTDIQAALQRPQDIAFASNVLNSNLMNRYTFDRDIANVYSGAATNPIWQQPSPTSSALGGIGGIGGSILGAGFPTGWLGGSSVGGSYTGKGH